MRSQVAAPATMCNCEEQEARRAPVLVPGRSELGDERLARPDLRQEDRVVRDEQRQSGQRPEGQPVPDVVRDRRGPHVSSYDVGHAIVRARPQADSPWP